MKQKIKNLGIYKLYAIVFFIVFLLVFIPISIKNLNIGYSGLFEDGLTQHYLFFRDYIIKFKDFLFRGVDFNLFDFNLGYGADTIASYTYYNLFDPFNIIGIILPIKWSEFSFYLITVLKFYLGGLFFILFANKILIKNKWALLVSGILYVFNSSILMLSLRHNIFTGVLMIFPLMLLGAYKIIKNENPYVLIFATLYAILSQFYLFAYAAFGFEIFVLIRSYAGSNQSKVYLKNLFKTNLYFIIGILLGSFILIPQFFAVLGSGRINGNVITGYSSGYYATLIFGHFIPTPVMSQSNSIGNFFALILVILFLLFFKKEKWMKLWILVQVPLLLFPIFGYILSLFSYVNNRWSFIIVAPICLIVGYVIENIKEVKREQLNIVFKICSYLFSIALTLIFYFLIDNYMNINTICSIFLKIIVTGLFILICYFIFKFDFNKLKIKNYDSYSISKDFILVNIILIFLFNFGLSFCLTDGYIADKYYKNEFNSSLINDNNFYRVSKYSYVGNIIERSNDSIYGNYSSTFFYNTINNGKIINFIDYFNVSNRNVNVGYNGVGKRYILETISGVKYYISKDSENRSAPYNFSYYDNYESIKYKENDYNASYDKFLKEDGKYINENNIIYINNNYLPLGFVYDSYIDKSYLDNLSPLERQVYLSKAVILENAPNIKIEKYNNEIHNSLLKEINYEIIKSDGISIKNNQIIVNSSNNVLELKANNLTNSELYIEFKGLSNINSFSNNDIKYSSEDENWIETIFYEGENLYINNEDQLLYMGYDSLSKERILKISFKNKGIYNYDSLKVYSLSMNEMINDINKLNSSTLQDISVNNNSVSGNINTNKDCLLFLSIPYEEGFKAYVNGKETKILNANIGFIGIELNKGNNEILLEYEVPYLNLGFKVSLLGLILLIGYSLTNTLIYINKKKKAIS